MDKNAKKVSFIIFALYRMLIRKSIQENVMDWSSKTHDRNEYKILVEKYAGRLSLYVIHIYIYIQGVSRL